MKSRDIIAEIRSEIPSPSRPRRWFDRLNGEQKKLVDLISAAWISGELGQAARPVAPAIARKLHEAGINVTPSTVREWLAELRKT